MNQVQRSVVLIVTLEIGCMGARERDDLEDCRALAYHELAHARLLLDLSVEEESAIWNSLENDVEVLAHQWASRPHPIPSELESPPASLVDDIAESISRVTGERAAGLYRDDHAKRRQLLHETALMGVATALDRMVLIDPAQCRPVMAFLDAGRKRHWNWLACDPRGLGLERVLRYLPPERLSPVLRPGQIEVLTQCDRERRWLGVLFEDLSNRDCELLRAEVSRRVQRAVRSRVDELSQAFTLTSAQRNRLVRTATQVEEELVGARLDAWEDATSTRDANVSGAIGKALCIDDLVVEVAYHGLWRRGLIETLTPEQLEEIDTREVMREARFRDLAARKVIHLANRTGVPLTYDQQRDAISIVRERLEDEAVVGFSLTRDRSRFLPAKVLPTSFRPDHWEALRAHVSGSFRPAVPPTVSPISSEPPQAP